MNRRLLFLAPLIALAILTTGGRAMAAPDAAPPYSYTIKPGDTLMDLANRYMVSHESWREVQALNHIPNDRRLKPGSSLLIPDVLLRMEPIVGAVIAFSGLVTVDQGQGPVPVRLGMKLGENSAIATGPNAFTTLQLPDESRITVPSQSKVRIQRLRHVAITDALDRVFSIEQGRTESTVTHMPNPKSRYLITTPVASSAVRGTVFRAGFDAAAGNATSEVVKGLVGVTGAKGETAVPAGFGAVTSADGAPVQAKLLPAPAILDPDRVQSGPQARFALTPVQGARRYHVQLANDAGFFDIFREGTFDGPMATFDGLADGTYFVRAAALDAGGLEGLSQAYGFTRDANAPPGAVTDGHTRPYLFRWTAPTDAKAYRFQLFARPDASGKPMFDVPQLIEPQVKITDLPTGDYYWRVVASTGAKGGEWAGDLQPVHVGR